MLFRTANSGRGQSRMIRFDGVAKRYGDAVALAPTDLQLPRAKTSVLIGPSGGGKSTVLRLIAGLIQPSVGSILIDGQELSPRTVRPIRRRLGYVIQDGGLFPHLTARQNILLAAREFGLLTAELTQRLDELRALVRLKSEELGRYPLELSGGQRQRVSLLRALMLKPDLLLLDEPLGALDPMVRASLLVDLKEIFRQLRPTVVLVTHDLGEAAHFADHMVLLNGGRVVQQGTYSEISGEPAELFVTEFLDAHRSLTR